MDYLQDRWGFIPSRAGAAVSHDQLPATLRVLTSAVVACGGDLMVVSLPSTQIVSAAEPVSPRCAGPHAAQALCKTRVTTRDAKHWAFIYALNPTQHLHVLGYSANTARRAKLRQIANAPCAGHLECVGSSPAIDAHVASCLAKKTHGADHASLQQELALHL